MSNRLSRIYYLGIMKKEGHEISSNIFNVTCSDTIAKNWTPTAIDCYQIGCSCSKCNLNKIYFLNSPFKCQMKKTVFELVKKLGAPN